MNIQIKKRTNRYIAVIILIAFVASTFLPMKATYGAEKEELDVVAITAFTDLAELGIDEPVVEGQGKIFFSKSTGMIFEATDGIKKLNIPKEIHGYEVIGIAERTFSDQKNLREVHLPNGLEVLGVNCFNNCDKLTEIVIPNTVKMASSEKVQGIENLCNMYTGFIEGLEPDEAEAIKEEVLKQYKSEFCGEMADNYVSLFSEKGRAFIIKIVKELGYELTSEALSLMFDYIDLAKEIEEEANNAEDLAGGPFSGCDGLKTVTFEDGMESVPAFIFKNCNGIEKITFPESVHTIEKYAFQGCVNLYDIEFPSELKALETGAFDSCPKITELYFPKSLTEAGSVAGGPFTFSAQIAFPGMNGEKTMLSKVEFEEGTEKIPAHIFHGSAVKFNEEAGKDDLDLVIPNSVTSIGDFAFYECDNLTEIEVPVSVSTLGLECFGYCKELKSVSLKGIVTKTGGANASPFEGSTIKQVILSDKQTTIPANMFSNCDSITEFTVPEGITSIGNHAFYKCSNLSSINLPTTLSKLGLECFGYCGNLDNVVFNSVLTKTGGTNAGPFEKSGVKNVTLSKDQKIIPQNMFSMCDNMTDFNVSAEITKISNYAFSSCKNLRTVTLMNSNTEIEKNAFYNVKNIDVVR